MDILMCAICMTIGAVIGYLGRPIEILDEREIREEIREEKE